MGPDARAQATPTLQKSETTAKTNAKEPTRSLAEWQADVDKRIQEAEGKSAAAKQEDSEPSPALKRHLEILTRLDLTLTQQADEQGKTEQT